MVIETIIVSSKKTVFPLHLPLPEEIILSLPTAKQSTAFILCVICSVKFICNNVDIFL